MQYGLLHCTARYNARRVAEGQRFRTWLSTQAFLVHTRMPILRLISLQQTAKVTGEYTDGCDTGVPTLHLDVLAHLLVSRGLSCVRTLHPWLMEMPM